MELYNTKNNMGHETFEYKEEINGEIIEVTLKLKLDTKWKSVQNYIERCQGKQCLAAKTIKDINRKIKMKYEN